MASKTMICNRAIHFIGIGEEIASINERSAEAEACLAFYEDALDELLREWPWPFARRTVDLAEVNDLDSDGNVVAYNDEFFYAYRYPTDAVFIRRLVSGVVPDNPDSLLRYQIASDDAGRLILTNVVDATAEYTVRVADTSLFPSDFAMALSFRLASYIAPRLAEDPDKASKLAMAGYERSMAKARAVAAMEENEGKPPMSSFQRSR